MSRTYAEVPKSETTSRVSRLQSLLRSNGLDGALLMSVTELYYYSGIGSPGVVYVPPDGEPVRLSERNLDLVKSFSPLTDVRPMGRLSMLFETLKIESSSQIAIEEDILPFSLVRFLQSKARGVGLVDGSKILRLIRSVKSDYEINLMEKAAALVDESFEYCTEIADPDMTEIELALQLDSWMVERGHAGFITTRTFNSAMVQYSYVISSGGSTLNTYFTPISGQGLSLKYPLGSTRRKLGRNRPFLVDTVGNCQGYLSDTTRTFVCGQYKPEIRNQLDALAQIKQLIASSMKPGKNLGELYGEVVNLSEELGIYKDFMGTESDKVVFLGHGVGLELDELPVFYSKGPDLSYGNTLACEPKLIIPGEILLGIEDTYVLADGGNRILSRAPTTFEM
ncbi:MAG: M24 family metallopeptidase [Candidatus Thorarchaeota archaeon]|jgi:Xaa-Pro aminopeptidase